MPRRLVIPALLAGLVVLLAACTGGSDGGGSSAPASASSSAPARAFTVELPTGWSEDRSRVTGGAVVAFYTGPAVDDFRINLNVTRESAKGLTLQRFQAQSVTGLRRTLTIRNLSGVSATTVDGERALRYTFEDTQEGSELKQSQVVVLHGGYGYVLTFTAPVDRYDDYAKAAASIVGSLRWS